MTKKEINKEEVAGRKRWKISGKDEALMPLLLWRRPCAMSHSNSSNGCCVFTGGGQLKVEFKCLTY